jgi:hypothetical protein
MGVLPQKPLPPIKISTTEKATKKIPLKILHSTSFQLPEKGRKKI